ncbi:MULTISPECIES: hypothetical protein [unclassified Mesorhizobium]|uniref:hypothetical protein n=1 Tax=unclassified Mesorhizobium TaxID=325217 RepID=UPI000FE3BF7D|nr:MULTISPECIES: hypothetical protein [unclassified Mesorhizobium]RWF33715.1 MAG: hypothetical protein EOS45_01935 [Mesorhizobium sp.]RWX68920.1 hypothetical protein EN780_07810 [Mesorhizobium sp. M4B.F.Ca.ET.089.01.1.1]
MASILTAANEAAMLALDAAPGDIAWRTDTKQFFILDALPASALENWREYSPFRLRVVKGVCAALKTITPANGHLHDFSDFIDDAGRPAERVFRGRTVYGDGDPLPMLSVLEDPRAREPVGGGLKGGFSSNEFRLLIQGFVQDDKDHPLDPAYLASADVISALVKAKLVNNFNFLGLGNVAPCVIEILIGEPVHRPPDDEISAVAYFLVPVTLILAENFETPFA